MNPKRIRGGEAQGKEDIPTQTTYTVLPLTHRGGEEVRAYIPSPRPLTTPRQATPLHHTPTEGLGHGRGKRYATRRVAMRRAERGVHLPSPGGDERSEECLRM